MQKKRQEKGTVSKLKRKFDQLSKDLKTSNLEKKSLNEKLKSLKEDIKNVDETRIKVLQDNKKLKANKIWFQAKFDVYQNYFIPLKFCENLFEIIFEYSLVEFIFLSGFDNNDYVSQYMLIDLVYKFNHEYIDSNDGKWKCLKVTVCNISHIKTTSIRKFCYGYSFGNYLGLESNYLSLDDTGELKINNTESKYSNFYIGVSKLVNEKYIPTDENFSIFKMYSLFQLYDTNQTSLYQHLEKCNLSGFGQLKIS